jgi:hypothetical protein
MALGTVFVLNSVALLIFPAYRRSAEADASAVWTVGGAGHS